ncbi:MAG: hypothetical protein KDB29_06725 [Planctomycetes bacterium]|nr:hypothetical protein [Planctomycetota bacterium]
MTSEPGAASNGRSTAFLLLTGGLIAALVSSGVVYLSVTEQAAELRLFAAELPRATKLVIAARVAVLGVPVVVWVAGVAATGFGRRRQPIAILAGVGLLAFSVVWPLAASFAMQLPFQTLHSQARDYTEPSTAGFQHIKTTGHEHE